MNCAEAEVYVSAVYDGESVPPEAKGHIVACERCREVLHEYSRMGAELRLAATTGEEALPPLPLHVRRRPWRFLWRRVAVPRLALAGLVAGLILALVMVSIVRAQTRPLWFQFSYQFEKGRAPLSYMVAKQGYDDMSATSEVSAGSIIAVALHTEVESISQDDVAIRCRAVASPMVGNARRKRLVPLGRKRVPLNGTPVIHYKPGETLAIPVEGGGTIYLTGEVLDHQPKIAFGIPLEPPADKMVVRSPALTSGDRTIAGLDGASAMADAKTPVVILRAGAEGSFLFALQRFPGAIRGEAEWGEIRFRLGDQRYRLMAAAPITGGEQPRAIWVRHDAEAVDGVGLGAIAEPLRITDR